MKDLPYSFYEIFAIFIPGFILINTIWMFSFSSLTYITFPGGVVESSFVIIFSYVLGQAISHVSKFLLEEIFVRRFIGECCLYMTKHLTPSKVMRRIFIEHTKPLPSNHVTNFLELIGRPSANEVKDIVFVTIYTKAQSDERIKATLEYWQRLYHGFRNLSLTFLILCLYSVYKYIEGNESGLQIGSIFLLLTIIMFYRYVSFSKYYCRDLIMWFTSNKLKLD